MSDPLPGQSEPLDWRRPRYDASVWWCGDEYCDCQQPQIVLRTPNLTVGRPWDRLTTIWQGEFTTGGEGYSRLAQELAGECERRGIPVGNSYAEDQPADIARRIDDEQMAEAQKSMERLGL